VQIGHLRQVMPGALQFSFELLAPGVELEIVEVPAEGRCRTCGADSVQRGFPLACAQCGGLDVEVVRGEELTVESLEVEADPERALTVSGKAER
jgi:hydrogenase nickel incorporation protein HypA/HybF